MIKIVERALAAGILPDNPEQAKLDDLRTIVLIIQDRLTIIAGGVAVIFLIWSAILYFTAYGNEERANQGKKTFYWTIVGIVIIILAEVIVRAVWQFTTSAPFLQIK